MNLDDDVYLLISTCEHVIFDFENVGNGTKSCMDVGSFEQWVWCHAWNDEEQSDMGGVKNAC